MAEGVSFEVEHLLRGRDAYVFARQVGAEHWRLAEGATLDGHRIRPVVSSPRALGPDGKPRFDLFAFELVHPRDIDGFKVGQRVLLRVR